MGKRKFVIAICTDVKKFQKNQIFEEAVANNYPGSLWCRTLHARSMIEQGYSVVTGDIAIEMVRSGSVNIKEILVIQDENSKIGDELLRFGARGFILTCFESPMYAKKFYATLGEYSKYFEYCILFKGALSLVQSDAKKDILFFPSFSVNERELAVRDWYSRGNIVMVAGNKYWKTNRGIFRSIAATIRDFIYLKKQYTDEGIKKNQLHDVRLELIFYFEEKRKLELFGPGWSDLSILPKAWQLKLNSTIKRLNPHPCKDKILTISNFKFNLCLENMSYPGYVTEKIIDCFKAKVIPIYLGAPDIEDFVPREAFINLNSFKSFDELNNFIENMTPIEAENMLRAASAFLQSPKCMKFSYEFFAETVVELIWKN